MFPKEPAYTACYCEENVRLLCESLQPPDLEAYAVFISNPERSVLMWNSQAVAPESPVVWDYHVVLLVNAGTWVIYDHDFTGERPCLAQQWLVASFAHLFLAQPVQLSAPPQFKLVPHGEYIAHFSSSRAHMRTEDGAWNAPPPAWPPFQPEPDNLKRYIDMNDTFDGQVLDLPALCRRLSG